MGTTSIELALRTSVLSAALAASATAQVPLFAIDGEVADARLGAALASGADLDGDSFDDLLIGSPVGAAGSPLAPDAPPSPLTSGRAIIVSGKTGATILTLLGPSQLGDLFGFSVAIIGDTNFDGVPEVAVGAPRHDSSFNLLAGSVSVYSGSSGALRFRIFGATPGDHFGAAVSGYGDANLDGLPDVVAGAPFSDGPGGIDAGSIRLFTGVSGLTLKTVVGLAAGDRFGAVLAPGGDLTGDGFPDFVVGTPNAFDSTTSLRPGRVSFFSASGTLQNAALGTQDGERFGAAIAPIADFTGDGKGDLLVGAPGFQSGIGAVGAASIVSTQTQQIVLGVTGTSPGEGLGASVIAIPDLDAHPAPDFAAGTSDGRIRFIGGNGVALGQLQGAGGFGSSLALGEDVNGDLERELAIGAPHLSTPSLDECGRVVMHDGPALGAALKFSSSTPLEFAIVPGVVPEPQELDVVGVGFGAASFLVTRPAEAAWLIVAPESGAIDGLGDSAPVSFAVDPTKLSSATASTLVTLRDSTTLVPFATLVVSTKPGAPGADPVLCVASSVVDFVAPQGLSIPPPQNVALSNCGNASLLLLGTASIEPPGTSWLAVNESSFTIAPGTTGEIELSCDASALPPGDHSATLRLANSAGGQVVDIPVHVLAGSIRFALGDKLKGVIADASDVDLAVFDGIEGLPVEIKGGPKNGSKPKLSLLGPDGVAVDTWIPASSKSKKAFLLDRAGAWRLRVESGDGLPGEFSIKTKRDGLPVNAQDLEKTIVVDSPPNFEFTIGALPGCKLALAKVSPKTQPIGDLTFALETPQGATFDLAAFDQLGSKAYSLTQVPLEAGGSWRFSIGGLVTGSKVKVVFDLEQPKVGKSTLTID